MSLPLVVSLVSLVWFLAFGGMVVHWRAGKTVPTGALAALMLAVAGAVWSRIVGATMYSQPRVHCGAVRCGPR